MGESYHDPVQLGKYQMKGDPFSCLKVCNCGRCLVEGLCLCQAQGRSEDPEEGQVMPAEPAWPHRELQEWWTPVYNNLLAHACVSKDWVLESLSDSGTDDE